MNTDSRILKSYGDLGLDAEDAVLLTDEADIDSIQRPEGQNRSGTTLW